MKARVCAIGRFKVSSGSNDDDDDDAEFPRDTAGDKGITDVNAGVGVTAAVWR